MNKIESSVMNTMKAKESGFTLVEALVAFLIAAVGLAGAALFQSQLIAESGSSKARSVAIKLAENELEVRRNAFFDGDYAELDSLVASASTSTKTVSVGNAVYTVRFTPTSAAATAVSAATDTYYQFTTVVEWTDAENDLDSVSLSTFLSSNDPENSLDESDDAGSGSDSDIGKIKRPSGSAVAIARVTTTASSSSAAIGEFVRLTEATSSSQGTFGIKTSDNGTNETRVSVIELLSGTDIFKITGDIYIDDSAASTLADKDDLFNDISLAPNVLTSEGGGCAVYKKADSQPAYTCLFGVGWYGNISLILPGGDKPDGTVCLSPRSYKYYIMNPVSTANLANNMVSGAVLGQSGLVRFTVDGGGGPYLASSNVSPGFGYYYRSKELNENTTVVSGASTAGDVEWQHFVINGDKPNSVADMYEVCVTDSNPYLFTSSALNTTLFHQYVSAGYPALTSDNFLYNTPSSGDPVVIPSQDVILGYVNKASELSGGITVSGAASTATVAADLKNAGKLAVSRDNPSQECSLNTVNGSSLEYTCLIPYEWTGSITLSVSSPLSIVNDGFLSYTATEAITNVVSSGSTAHDFTVDPN